MLPRRLKDRVSADAKQLLDKGVEAIYRENQGRPLVGVINIKTGAITLYPCIKEKVWLEIDAETGRYSRAWKQERGKLAGEIKKGDPIQDEKLSDYNNNVFAPRVMSVKDKNDREMVTSHMYLINMMGEVDNQDDYRGFSVIPGEEEGVKFIWDSTSLNKRGLTGSKQMKPEHQEMVLTKMKPLIAPVNAHEEEKVIPVTPVQAIKTIVPDEAIFSHYMGLVSSFISNDLIERKNIFVERMGKISEEYFAIVQSDWKGINLDAAQRKQFAEYVSPYIRIYDLMKDKHAYFSEFKAKRDAEQNSGEFNAEFELLEKFLKDIEGGWFDEFYNLSISVAKNQVALGRLIEKINQGQDIEKIFAKQQGDQIRPIQRGTSHLKLTLHEINSNIARILAADPENIRIKLLSEQLAKGIQRVKTLADNLNEEQRNIERLESIEIMAKKLKSIGGNRKSYQAYIQAMIDAAQKHTRLFTLSELNELSNCIENINNKRAREDLIKKLAPIQLVIFMTDASLKQVNIVQDVFRNVSEISATFAVLYSHSEYDHLREKLNSILDVVLANSEEYKANKDDLINFCKSLSTIKKGSNRLNALEDEINKLSTTLRISLIPDAKEYTTLFRNIYDISTKTIDLFTDDDKSCINNFRLILQRINQLETLPDYIKQEQLGTWWKFEVALVNDENDANKLAKIIFNERNNSPLFQSMIFGENQHELITSFFENKNLAHLRMRLIENIDSLWDRRHEFDKTQQDKISTFRQLVAKSVGVATDYSLFFDIIAANKKLPSEFTSEKLMQLATQLDDKLYPDNFMPWENAYFIERICQFKGSEKAIEKIKELKSNTRTAALIESLARKRDNKQDTPTVQVNRLADLAMHNDKIKNCQILIDSIKQLDSRIALYNQAKEFLKKYNRIYLSETDPVKKEEYYQLKIKLEKINQDHEKIFLERNTLYKQLNSAIAELVPEVKQFDDQCHSAEVNITIELHQALSDFLNKVENLRETIHAARDEIEALIKDNNNKKFDIAIKEFNKLIQLIDKIKSGDIDVDKYAVKKYIDNVRMAIKDINEHKPPIDQHTIGLTNTLQESLSKIGVNEYFPLDQMQFHLHSLRELQQGFHQVSCKLSQEKDKLYEAGKSLQIVAHERISSDKKMDSVKKSRKGLIAYYLLKTQESIAQGSPTRRYLDEIYQNATLLRLISRVGNEGLKKKLAEMELQIILATSDSLTQTTLFALKNTDVRFFELEKRNREQYLKTIPADKLAYRKYEDGLQYSIEMDILSANPSHMKRRIEYWLDVANRCYEKHDLYTAHLIFNAISIEKITRFINLEQNTSGISYITLSPRAQQQYDLLYGKYTEIHRNLFKTMEGFANDQVTAVPDISYFTYFQEKVGASGVLSSASDDFLALYHRAASAPALSSPMYDQILTQTVDSGKLDQLSKGVAPSKFRYNTNYSELKESETSIAFGVEQLINRFVKQEIGFDAQGIATIHVDFADLPDEIKENFPDQLKQGITLYILRDEQAKNQLHIESSNQSHLILDNSSKQFTYQSGATAYSDPRLICKGYIEQNNAHISQSLFMQSIAPLDDSSESKKFDHELFVSLYQHVLNTIKLQVEFRQLGRNDAFRQDMMEVDINYLISPTQSEKQKNYLRQIIRIFDSMDVPMEINGIQFLAKVNLTATEAFTKTKYFFSLTSDSEKEMQIENRKMHIRLVDATHQITRSFTSNIFSDQIKTLKYYADFDYELISLIKDKNFIKINGLLKASQNKLNRCISEYQMSTSPIGRSSLIAEMDLHRKTVDNLKLQLNDLLKNIESARKKIWNQNRGAIADALRYIESKPGEIKNLSDEQLKLLSILILQARIDELYYTDQYKNPATSVIYIGYQVTLQSLLRINTNVEYQTTLDRSHLIGLLMNLKSKELPSIFTSSSPAVFEVTESVKKPVAKPPQRTDKVAIAALSNKQQLYVPEQLSTVANLLTTFMTRPPVDVNIPNVNRFVIPKDKHVDASTLVAEQNVMSIVEYYLEKSKSTLTTGYAIDSVTVGAAKGSCYAECIGTGGRVDVALEHLPVSSQTSEAFYETAFAMLQTYIQDCKQVGNKKFEPIYIREVNHDDAAGIAISKAFIDICVANGWRYIDENKFHYQPSKVEQQYIVKPVLSDTKDQEVRAWCASVQKELQQLESDYPNTEDPRLQKNINYRFLATKQGIHGFLEKKGELAADTVKMLESVERAIDRRPGR